MKIDLRGQLKGARREDGPPPYGESPNNGQDFTHKIRAAMDELAIEKARLQAEMIRLDGRIAGLESALEMYRNPVRR